MKTKIENLFPESLDQIPEAFQPVVTNQNHYLMGHIRTHSGPVQDVYSPISVGGKPVYLGHYPLITADTALEGLSLAEQAWDGGNGWWPTTTHAERIRLMKIFVELMKKHREKIVRMIMWEICKTLPDAETEFDRTVQCILDTCDELETRSLKWEAWLKHGGLQVQEGRNPLGLVLCMGPSNYPLNETFTTLIPALLMGNVVLFKPAKWGVLLLEPLIECFEEAFPKNVVVTLYGNGADIIPPIVRTGKLEAFAFIGGTNTADRIIKENPVPHKTKLILGLGAKNPAIVLPGADLATAIPACVKGSLGYNGQRCTALKIIFVAKEQEATFIPAFVEAVEKLQPGLPWEEGTNLTPLLPESMGWMTTLLDDAKLHGAEVLNEGGGTINQGYLHPSVLYPVNAKMKLYREEQFGPLVPIVVYDDLAEVLEWIKTSKYAQQLSVFGTESDKNDILDIIEDTRNQRGRVNINALCQRGPDELPFTGRRDSAMGTLDIWNALSIFSIEDVVSVTDTPENKALLSI
ncbi:MAG: aldehyde dehydrogenase family protein [Candidatus Absconditabacteria bacterium]